MISKGGTHSGDFSMISFVEVFTLIEILAVGILPAYGFIQGLHISLSMVDYRR